MLVNLYATHRNPPPLSFAHTLHGRRDRSDAELAKHLEGFCGYVFTKGGGKMTAHLYHLIQHAQRVQHNLSLTVEEAELDGLCAWARQANAIMFYPDGSIRDDFGRMLLDPDDGSCAADAAIPFLSDALERKARSHVELERMGVRVPASLPPILSAHELLLRSPEEVARRALALLVVALRAESLNNGEPWDVSDMRKRFPAGFAALSPREKQFMESGAPEQQDIVDHVWRYEALALLSWALRLVDELALPVGICDVKATVQAVTATPAEAMIAGARLRDGAQILDAADLHYRLHWASRQAVQIDKGEPPAGLEPGVIAERRHAINWLMRFQEADWDDVDTPT